MEKKRPFVIFDFRKHLEKGEWLEAYNLFSYLMPTDELLWNESISQAVNPPEYILNLKTVNVKDIERRQAIRDYQKRCGI